MRRTVRLSNYLWFQLKKQKQQTNQFTKASLTLNDLRDGICMTHNQFSDFHCVYTFIQVVHTEFIKVACTEHLAFKSLSKMSPEQAASAVIIALISKENMSKKKKQKREVWNRGLKEWKT